MTVPLLVPPNLGLTGYFSFKEPFATYIKNKLNLDTYNKKLTVVSVISIKDMTLTDLRNPFVDIYTPAGASEADYSKDLENNTPIISFQVTNTNTIFRVPFTYVIGLLDVSNVEYINKLIVIDLGKVPTSLDTTVYFTELLKFIYDHLGVNAQAKEVAMGNPVYITQEEHDTREAIRQNAPSIYQTSSLQLAQLQLKYNELVNRLNQLGIILGE